MTKDKIYKTPLIFVGVLIFTAMVLYNAPRILQTMYFLIILVVFWKTKIDYFWLAFTLTITEDIGGAFLGLASDILKFGQLEISFLHLFTMVSFLKLSSTQNKTTFLFKKPLNIYIVYILFLIYLGFFIYGNEGGGKSGLRYYLLTFFFLLTTLNIITVPKILNSLNKVEKFSRLIFITLTLNLIGQFFHLLNGVPLFIRFGEISTSFREVDSMERLVRPVWGHVNILIGMSVAMFFLITKNKNFKNSYILFIILISSVSIFIGATRGWIITLGFLLVVFFIHIKISKSFLIISSSIILITVAVVSSNLVRVQFSHVLERLMTLEKLAQGDVTAGGTNVRLTTRHDKVMNVFYRYPVFGKGFSTEAMEKNDQHVGHQNILMTGGIVGYMVILYFWLFYIGKILQVRSKLSSRNRYKRGLLFMIIILMATLLIHSSSTSLYGYLVYVKSNSKLFFMIILFTILNQFLLSAISDEKLIKTKKLNCARP